MAREYPLRAVVGRVVDGGESREWGAGMVNKWTRDDLPSISDLCQADDERGNGERTVTLAIALDAVVDHLNAHHPKSQQHDCGETIDALNRNRDALVENRDKSISLLQRLLANTEYHEARWRRAHEIVERERDQAREQWKKWEHKANEAEREVSTWRTSTESAHSDFLQAAHERDEAVARAEAAEARLADPYSQVNQDAAAWDRVAAHPALRVDLLPDVEGSYADCVFERITWLAEVEEAVTEMKPAVAAEARTAPAVTRDDIEKAIRGKVWAANRDPNKAGFHRVHIAWATDSVWSLVSGADPAVHVVRESDIEDCQRNEDGDWEFRHSGRVFYDSRDPADRAESLTHHREQVAQRVAIIRAIEAEPADPVTEKARELHEVAQGDGPFIVWEALTDVYRTHYRRIAAHILGQGEA